MKLQQLRYIWEVARHDLNVSATAQSLYTSQPGISKQIRLLEDELGVEIFARNGKHLTQITQAGKHIIEIAGDILRKAENIKRVAQDFSSEEHGFLSIATTHTQARYALPRVISEFIVRYPDVSLNMHQSSPVHTAKMAVDNRVDFAIATEGIENFSDLVVMPCYCWNLGVILPKNHPLSRMKKITLELLAKQPLVTYDIGFTGRTRLDNAFHSKGLKPKIISTAADADVIKTYVRLGMGVGVMANMAFDDRIDNDLVKVDVSDLFKPSITKIAFRKGNFLRGFMYEFIEKFAPHLTKKVVNMAIEQHGKPDEESVFAKMKLPIY